MAFFPPNPGGGPFPPRYGQNFGPPGPFSRQGNPYPPPFPPQSPIAGQGNPYFNPYSYGNQGQPFFNQNPYGMQGPGSFFPNQQPYGTPGFGGMSGQLNTLMGHVGTVTNGVNMLRQLGSFMGMFR